MEFIAFGPACFIANKPRAGGLVPNEPRPAINPVSKNGKRLPLRAFAYRDLNRQYWSNGEVLFADALERNRARELEAMKPVEAMTLEELEATQSSELMSESRRSYLETGVGVLHLDATDYEEGSIGEIIAAKGLDTLDLSAEEDPEREAEHNAFGEATPYVGLDPITAKQIDWEQAQYYTEPVRTVSLRDGKVLVDRSFPSKDEFLRIAKRVVRELLPDAGSDRHLAERVALTKAQAHDLGIRFERFVSNEVDRMTSLDDEVMHATFEFEQYNDAGEPETWIAVHRPYRRTDDGRIISGIAADDRKYGPWHGEVYEENELSVTPWAESDTDVERLFDLVACTNRECDDLVPGHSKIETGLYRGCVFCDSCGTVQMAKFHHIDELLPMTA